AYAYGAGKVIWVVSTAKIVKNLDDAMSRIEEYVLPLESERARKAYGADGSSINKILIIKKEVSPDRAQLIFVNEKLGF
ncbi:MAG: LUD domain-containing protein, partial [Candidatus Micrarchaeota archaeon]